MDRQQLQCPPLKQISDVVWEIPTSWKKGMNVPARIYGTKKLMDQMDLGVFNQVTNVACLPGIQKYAFCMPDGHIAAGKSISEANGATGSRSAGWRRLTQKKGLSVQAALDSILQLRTTNL